MNVDKAWGRFNAGSPPVTVPGTLRGYRKFIKLAGGSLISPNFGYSWKPNHTHTSACSVYEIVNATGPCDICAQGLVGIKVDSKIRTYNVKCRHIALYDYRDRFYPSTSLSSLVRFEIVNCSVTAVDLHREPAPSKGCGCGFYAAYDASSLFFPGAVGWSGPSSYHSEYLAAVEASGRIILGEKGFRAEKMRILCLRLITRGSSCTEVNFGFPAVDSLEEMIEKYPPDDISELLGSSSAPR